MIFVAVSVVVDGSLAISQVPFFALAWKVDVPPDPRKGFIAVL